MKHLFIILMSGGLVCCAASPGPVKRKMIGLLEKFDRWDYNGDGLLESSELDKAQKRGGIAKSEIIDFYDQNGDSKISRFEAQGAIERLDEAQSIIEEEGLGR